MTTTLTTGKLEALQGLLTHLLQQDQDGDVHAPSGLTDIDVNLVLNLVTKFRKSLARTRTEPSTPGYQYNEGFIIEELLQDPISQCSYVDIGASYPKECSNTWMLYRKGWRGLLIEPLPHCWPSIMKERPGDFIYPTAVSDSDGFAEFRVAGELSTLRDDWPIVDQATLTVETRKLSSILEEFPGVRDKCKFCSIDVEGHEKEVLSGTDFSSFSPDVYVIEYREHHPRKPGDNISAEWISLLTDHGYTLIAWSILNYIFVHDRKLELWADIRTRLPQEIQDRIGIAK